VSGNKLGKPMSMLGLMKDVTATSKPRASSKSTVSHELQLLERPEP